MPPHGEMTMDDNPLPISSPKQKKRSSDKKRREKKSSSSRRREKSQDDNHHDNDQQRQDEIQRKSKHGKKKSSKSSSHNNEPSSSSGDNKTKSGVTVAQFLNKQQQFQNEAASRKSNPTFRQKMMQEQHRNMIPSTGDPQQQQQEAKHYFDDDNSDTENNDQAVVRHNNQKQQQSSHIVDTLPADHPTSSTIQTHRTCTLCHRTLPRAQFSERDRFSVNLSLSPGVTCRTCSMTVCAVRLKSMPGTEDLLLEYAQRGMAQGLLALEGGAGDGNGGANGNIAGYLEASGDLTNSGEENALIVREMSGASGMTGKELTLYGAPMNGNNAITNPNINNNNQNTNIMGLNNPNAPFSGHAYSHSDADRPTNIADCKYIDALLQMPCYLNLNAFGLFTSAKDASVSLAALEAVRVYGTLEDGYFVPHDCDGVPVVKDDGKKGENRGALAKIPEVNPSEMNPKSTALLVLNEGPTPRTAILASQHYGWQTYAIDPSLSEEWDGYHNDIPNFTGYSGTLSDFMDNNEGSEGREGGPMVEFDKHVKHLVVIGMQPTRDSLRLKNEGHINEIRSRYNDVPTTLVSMSPIRKTTLVPRQRTNTKGMQECGSKLEGDVGYEPNCSYLDEGVFSDVRMVEVWNFHNAEDDDGSEGSYDSGEYSQEDEYEGEDGQYDEGEEGYYPEESNESDNVQKNNNKGRRHEVEEECHNAKKPSFDEQLQSLPGSIDRKLKKKKNLKKSAFLEERVAQNNNRKKSAFLEERVAQFKSENQQEGSDKDEHHGREVEHNDMMGSDVSTLGTNAFHQNSTLDTALGSSGIIVDGMNNEQQERSGQEQRPSNQDIANDSDDDYQDEENEEQQEQDDEEDAVWSLPDEEVANQVWEKALAKHDVQETLCDQFENFNYNGEDGGNNNDGNDADQDNQEYDDHHQEYDDDHQEYDDNQEEHDDNQEEQDVNHHDGTPVETHPEDPANDGLPPNWEAIIDASTGDYYYNNWETGEVTWDRPGDNQAPQDLELPPISPLEDGGVEDHNYSHHDDNSEGSRSTTQSCDLKPAAAAIATSAATANAPPLVSYTHKNNKDQQLDDITASDNDCDSHYVFDDMSSTSSGIAALSNWNTRKNNSQLKQSYTSKGSKEDLDDDMMFWSDDNEEADESGDVVGKTMRRTDSTASSKKPWHKNDSSDNAGLGGNDSFIYD